MKKSISTYAFMLGDGKPKEFFWGFQLSKEKPTFNWPPEELAEDEDEGEVLRHTLFLKNAVLGTAAVESEDNVVQVETNNFLREAVKHPIISLNSSNAKMCLIDLSFGNDVPLTFRLVDGGGPVYISGQHLIEYADDGDGVSEDEEVPESELSATDLSPIKSKKRKSVVPAPLAAKRGKHDKEVAASDSSEVEEDEEEMEDEDGDAEDEEGEDEDDESSPEIKTKPLEKVKQEKKVAAAAKNGKNEQTEKVESSKKKESKAKSNAKGK